jgi:hypothetical protein
MAFRIFVGQGRLLIAITLSPTRELVCMNAPSSLIFKIKIPFELEESLKTSPILVFSQPC